MKKDEIKGGLSALFGGTQGEAENLASTLQDEELKQTLSERGGVVKRGRPRKIHDEEGKRTDGYSRTTFILPDSKMEKVREIAFREHITLKETLEYALDLAIAKYEKKHGELTPRPRDKGEQANIFD